MKLIPILDMKHMAHDYRSPALPATACCLLSDRSEVVTESALE